MSYVVNRGCTYCNTCIFECPVQAIAMTDRGAWIDPDLCTDCGTCRDQCASEAIVHESEVRQKPAPRTKEARDGGVGAHRGRTG